MSQGGTTGCMVQAGTAAGALLSSLLWAQKEHADRYELAADSSYLPRNL